MSGPDAQPPPAGVPRWLWPPPGATLADVVIHETGSHPSDGSAAPSFAFEGSFDAHHANALIWLLDEHEHEANGPSAGETRTARLTIATSPLPGGRVGTAYAIDDGPLGAPAADRARGIVWRWLHAFLDDAAD